MRNTRNKDSIKSDKRKILEHYKKEAKEKKESPLSTMPDLGKRKREIDIILRAVSQIKKMKNKEDIYILDVGCGNGYTLEEIRRGFPSIKLSGIDITPEMVKLARERNIQSCAIEKMDIRNTLYQEETFDFIYTERTIQNILNWDDQREALEEIHRILKKQGFFLMIEGFKDAHENCNKARTELGLDTIESPHHNLLLEKDQFMKEIEGKFEKLNLPGIKYNFLSSYTFVRLVLHPLITRGEWIRNTEFVKFFGAVLPPTGNYARTQAFILRKI